MASVQDIETRIIGIENMLKFVLSNFKIQDPSNPFSQPTSLLDIYYKSLQVGPAVEAQIVKET